MSKRMVVIGTIIKGVKKVNIDPRMVYYGEDIRFVEDENVSLSKNK